MKKSLVLVAVATLFAGSAFAQECPSKGDFGTEISFNPFDQNGNTFKLEALKLRYFITDKDAIRLSLGFGISKVNDAVDNDVTNTTTGDFSLDLGYERHFGVAKRLDLYVGGELGFLTHFASGKGETVIDQEIVKVEYTNITKEDGDRAYSAFTAGIFTGLDFYVYKGLYVGAELGLYLNTGKTAKAQCVVSYADHEDITKIDGATAWTNCEFGVTPTLRLGWTF